MKEYLRVASQVMGHFLKANMTQVTRGQNQHVDSLATLASSITDEVSRLIKVELVVEPSINIAVGISVAALSKPCWIDPIIDFLTEY